MIIIAAKSFRSSEFFLQNELSSLDALTYLISLKISLESYEEKPIPFHVNVPSYMSLIAFLYVIITLNDFRNKISISVTKIYFHSYCLL